MHAPIKDGLEEYLKDPDDGKIPEVFRAHLKACSSCAEQVRVLEAQKQLLRSLRTDDQWEPRAGFYARVMNRIDEEEVESIWSALLEPGFGRRLAFACAAFVLVFGTYLVSTEPGEHNIDSSGVVMSQDRISNTGDHSVQPAQRNAVLVNLVTYQE